MFSLILPEGGQQLVVLAFHANGNTEAVLAELYAGTVADDDAAVNKVVVDALCVSHLCQEEVGIGGKNLLADGQLLEGSHQAGALSENPSAPPTPVAVLTD